MTHSGGNIFIPSRWKAFWPNFFKQFKYAYGDQAEYEKAMLDLTNDPQYVMWQRGGLAVDPHKVTDDYQTFKRLFGRISDLGDRGFNALKVMRLDMAKSEFNKLSEVEKSDPNTIKEISKLINNSTGATKIIVPKPLGVAFFAPRLEASRWQRLLIQPAKALKVFSNWNKYTPSEQAAAKITAKRSGEMMATLAGLLAANQALLSLSGSKQNINMTDPEASDWLKFKIGNKTIDATGGIVSTSKFIAGLIITSLESQKRLHGKERSDKIFNLLGSYVRGKLSPFASTLFDFATHKDYAKNVLPPFSDKPGKGKEHLTWREYLLQQQTPIPIAEAVKDINESMKEKGMKEPDITDLIGGIFTGTESALTGARVGNAPKKK